MLKQLFEKINSELLTEEVQLEMSAIFESAVNAAIAKKEVELDEKNKAEIGEFKEELIGKLDEYLHYFVEEFTRENEKQITDAVKVKTAERVLSTFESIVKDFNLQLSEQTVTDNAELDGAKSKISEQTETILALRKEIQAMQSEKIIVSIAEGLGDDVRKDKFRQLATTVSFISEEDYSKKLGILAESVKEKAAPAPAQIVDNVDDVTPPPVITESRVDRYVKNVSGKK